MFQYTRNIRAPGGEVYQEVYSYDGVGAQADLYPVGFEGEVLNFTRNADGSPGEFNSMPIWWAEPPANGEEVAKKLSGKKPVEPTRNVVTFVTYMADGRMQLQQRSYVSPQGKLINNPGYLSINGGLMESDDVEENLRREAMEELGVTLTSEFAKVGDVYDPEAGRSNHVFRLTTGYDVLLVEQFGVAEAVKALCSPEGLGRSFVWKGDLEAIMAANTLTGISVKILAAFPELMPPSRQD